MGQTASGSHVLASILPGELRTWNRQHLVPMTLLPVSAAQSPEVQPAAVPLRLVAPVLLVSFPATRCPLCAVPGLCPAAARVLVFGFWCRLPCARVYETRHRVHAFSHCSSPLPSAPVLSPEGLHF